MRKLLIATTFTIALALTGCGSDTPTSTDPTADTSAGVDATADATATTGTTPGTAAGSSTVCAEAIAYNQKAWQDVNKMFADLQAAITANDMAKLNEITANGEKIIAEWTAKLTEWAKANPESDVAAPLKTIADMVASDTATPAETEGAFEAAIAALTAACK